MRMCLNPAFSLSPSGVGGWAREFQPRGSSQALLAKPFSDKLCRLHCMHKVRGNLQASESSAEGGSVTTERAERWTAWMWRWLNGGQALELDGGIGGVAVQCRCDSTFLPIRRRFDDHANAT